MRSTIGIEVPLGAGQRSKIVEEGRKAFDLASDV